MIGIRVEPVTLSAKPLQQTGTTLSTTRRLFNAELAIENDRGVPGPYLAEALPQLNTDTWRVFPDGRMETRYVLRPNLAWHDGVALSPEDFGFSWRVYATPALGVATSPPQGLIEEVAAPDGRTVVVRWKRPYPAAGTLAGGLPALPQHLLEAAFSSAEGGPDAFAAQPYWTREYVGLGAYRLTQWEPGAFIEGEAFGGYVLGRPKIDRVRVMFINDPNVALAAILAEEVHFLADVAIRFQQGGLLKRDWVARGAGSVLVVPGLFRATYFQFRRELVEPRALLDSRVRKALAHTMDKQAVNEGIYEGEGILVDTMIPPLVDYFPEVERAVARYPYDGRRAEQLMAEAGFRRGADGFYAAATEGRVGPELRTNASAQFEAEQSILGDGWRRAGFDVREFVLPAALVQAGEARATFPGLYTFSSQGGETALRSFHSESIPRPENRWVGSNRGGWIHEDYSRLSEVLDTTLDRSERIRQVVRLSQILNEELPAISLSFDPGVLAHVAALRGPRAANSEGNVTWNIHDWEMR